MIAFNGSTQYVEQGQVLDETCNGPFTIALLVKATMTARCYLLGHARHSGVGNRIGLALALNSDATNLNIDAGGTRVGAVAFKAGWTGSARTRYYVDVPGLFDGDVHSLVFIRDGTNNIVYLDGTYQSPVVTENSGAGGTIGQTQKLVIGAIRTTDASQNPLTSGFAAATVGEFIYIARAISEVEARLLAGLWSSRFVAFGAQHWKRFSAEWQGGGALEEIGGWTWSAPAGSSYVAHPRIVEPEGPAQSHRPDLGRSANEVYVVEGRDPVVGTDVPRVVLPGRVSSVALGGLGLTPLAEHRACIVPRNDVGRGAASNIVRFRTNGSGEPSLAPAPVTRLRAVALADGEIRVDWEHSSIGTLAAADHFEVRAVPQFAGAAAIDPVTVPHVAPRPLYSVRVALPVDGLWLVSVVSVAADGAADDAVGGVLVRSDSAAPVGAPVGVGVA